MALSASSPRVALAVKGKGKVKVKVKGRVGKVLERYQRYRN
jgi:hypothetical protein